MVAVTLALLGRLVTLIVWLNFKIKISAHLRLSGLNGLH